MLDLLPTLTEMAGVSEKPEKKLDGKSLLTLLSGDSKGKWDPLSQEPYFQLEKQGGSKGSTISSRLQRSVIRYGE